MKTTLNKVRSHSPCKDGWKKLLRHLGKTKADDEPLNIITILDINGVKDALWCLRAVDGHDKEIRMLAVWCARRVQYLMNDRRSLDALDVAEWFANGEATAEELQVAYVCAVDAANAADFYADNGSSNYSISYLSSAGAARSAAFATSCSFDYSYGAADAAISAVVDAGAELIKQEQELRLICSITN